MEKSVSLVSHQLAGLCVLIRSSGGQTVTVPLFGVVMRNVFAIFHLADHLLSVMGNTSSFFKTWHYQRL